MQQKIYPTNEPIKADIFIPGSKSMTNRALLLAALADGVSEIDNIQISDDTKAFMTALQQLGTHLTLTEHSCRVTGNKGQFPNKVANLWCADSGTTLRFLLAAAAATPGHYTLDGSARLRERPITSLIEMLAQQGIQFTNPTNQLPLSFHGVEGLAGGQFLLDGTMTSQIISALLMIAPYARNPFDFTLSNVVSQPYIEMTCTMMKEFGVEIHRQQSNQYHIPISQCYQAKKYCIEPDFSTASYFFAAAAVTAGEITIQSTPWQQSKQSDARFLDVLEQMGCQVYGSQHGLTLKGPKQLQGIEVDMRHFSDTFLTLAAIAPFAATPTRITHIGHTRLKESDRIMAIKTELQKLKVRVESGEDWIHIFPSTPFGCIVNSHHDHRVAMALSIIGLKTPNVLIDHAECVAKTCPEFFELWNTLYGYQNRQKHRTQVT